MKLSLWEEMHWWGHAPPKILFFLTGWMGTEMHLQWFQTLCLSTDRSGGRVAAASWTSAAGTGPAPQAVLRSTSHSTACSTGHRSVSDQPLPTGHHPKAPEKTSACWLHPGLISSSLAELLVGHVTFLWPRFQFWCCTNSGLTGRYIHVLNTQGMGEAKK